MNNIIIPIKIKKIPLHTYHSSYHPSEGLPHLFHLLILLPNELSIPYQNNISPIKCRQESTEVIPYARLFGDRGSGVGVGVKGIGNGV